MNSIDIFAECKNRLEIVDVIQRYTGLEPNKGGYISCVFHQEKTPSLKIYRESNSWYCNGCGVGGDCVKFIAMLNNFTNFQAAELLNSDYGLNLPIGKKLKPAEIRHIKSDNKKRERLRNYIGSFDEWVKQAYHTISDLHRTKPPRATTLDEGRTAAEFLALQSMTDFLFDELQECRTLEQQCEFYKNYHKTIDRMKNALLVTQQGGKSYESEVISIAI